MRIYTGIGSRETPIEIQDRMTEIARWLGRHKFILRSGAAPGADSAFERGCDEVAGFKEIFLPWEGFERRSAKREEHCLSVGDAKDARKIAEDIHPAWHACSDRVKALHTRNVFQVLGPYLAPQHATRLVICWTPEGKSVGGTATALSLAKRHRVPVFNLATRDWTLREMLKIVVERRTQTRSV